MSPASAISRQSFDLQWEAFGRTRVGRRWANELQRDAFRFSLFIVAIAGSLFSSNMSVYAQRPSRDNPVAITFSLDVQGPTTGKFGTVQDTVDSFHQIEINGYDILTAAYGGPGGPNPPTTGPSLQTPGTLVFGSDQNAGVSRSLGLTEVSLGGESDEGEIDALSYGNDQGNGLFFSVDEFAVGLWERRNGVGSTLGTEGAGGLAEAAADIFRYRGPNVPTLLAGSWSFGHSGEVDGNGIDGDGNGFPGLGLIEPNPQTPHEPFDVGDNLDAFDINTTATEMSGAIYFSLDAGFADPLEEEFGVGGPNIGTAQVNGFYGADILLSNGVSGSAIRYLAASKMGLDLDGSGTDDLDALALDENGDMSFDPDEDQLLFSVRRGSSVIGKVDSRLGLPISPGDILAAPASGSPAGTTPQIYVPAETLGLFAARGTGNQFSYDEDGSGLDGLVASGDMAGLAASFESDGEEESDDLDGLDSYEADIDGDMNCDGALSLPDDGNAFVYGLTDAGGYTLDASLCDFNGPTYHGNFDDSNTDFDFRDIAGFKQALMLAGVISEEGDAELITTIPEPPTGVLFSLGLLSVMGVLGGRWALLRRPIGPCPIAKNRLV